MLAHHRSAIWHCTATRSIAAARSGVIARTKSLTYRFSAGLTFVPSLFRVSVRSHSLSTAGRLGDHFRLVPARHPELYQSVRRASRKIWNEFTFYHLVA